MEPETTGIIISTAVATKALDVALAWVKAKFAKNPQPFITEQTSYQAKMKENEKDHENLFLRMSSLEKEHAALSAKVDAKFDAITEQLRETKDMVRQLFDRICKGKK